MSACLGRKGYVREQKAWEGTKSNGVVKDRRDKGMKKSFRVYAQRRWK